MFALFFLAATLCWQPASAGFSPAPVLSELPVRMGERYVLARMESAHFTGLLEILHHPDVLQASGWPVLSERAIQFWIDESIPVYRLPANWTLSQPRFFTRGVFEQKRLVGLVVFEAINQTGVAKLSYAFHPSCWGKGLADRTIRVFINMGFKQLGLQEIESQASVTNKPAVHLLQKLNFQVCGNRRNHFDTIESHFRLTPRQFYTHSSCNLWSDASRAPL